MSDLRQSLIRSVANEGIPPVRLVSVRPVALSERYWALHRKCAAGTIAPDEAAELEMMCAEMERGE